MFRRLLSVMMLCFAASAASAATPATVEVSIQDFAFAPATITVPKGTTIVWVNNDQSPHSVVATGKEFRSQALDTGDKFSRTFDAPGTFAYGCGLHPQMKATVVVTPQ